MVQQIKDVLSDPNNDWEKRVEVVSFKKTAYLLHSFSLTCFFRYVVEKITVAARR